MLKELFESSFYVTYPAKKDTVINIDEHSYINDFQLRDINACRACHNVCEDRDADRIQLYVKTLSELSCVSVDQIVGYIGESVGRSCDYLCDDNKKSALIEMTCSNTEWVGSKRQEARGQLYNTLCLFYANPMVREHFENEQSKYVIFSWKDTTRNKEDDQFLDSMLGMTVMSDAAYSVDNESNFDFGFKLKEIRFPEPLSWDAL